VKDYKNKKRPTFNFGRLELPGGNLILEKQIDLAERAIFRLRQTEPTPKIAKQVSARVENTGFGSPIPS
jgi:hypothetical protein